MFRSPTIYKPIIASLCNVSRERGNQNIFFITFMSDFLCGRFIILYSMSMMSSLVSLLLMRDIFISRTFSSIVSFLVTCITADSRQIFSSVIFVEVLTSGVMRTSSGFLGVYHEILIFTSHLFFSSCYSSFFLREFFPYSTELDWLLSGIDYLNKGVPCPRETI